MAFQVSSGSGAGMSVDLEALISEAGLDPKDYVATPPWLGSVRFEAASLRTEGFWIGYDPLPENPHHGEVWENSSSGQQKFTRGQRRRLQSIAVWYVPIEDVDLSE